jgi:hypothetical protein
VEAGTQDARPISRASTAFSEATLCNWKDSPVRLKIARRGEPASQPAPAGWGIKPRPPTAVPSGIGRSGRRTEQLIPHRGTFQGPAARLSSSGPPIPIPRSRFIGSRPRNDSSAQTKPFSLTDENNQKQTPGINTSDQTSRFDRVGYYHQPALPPVLQEIFGRRAKAAGLGSSLGLSTAAATVR